MVTAYLSGYEHVQRELLMQLFARHVSNDVADEIWQHREDFTESGRPAPRKLVATVLFTDIEHFTTVSEKLGPQALMEWLNTYMEAMSNRIIEHGGVIDDYYGDAIKANKEYFYNETLTQKIIPEQQSGEYNEEISVRDWRFNIAIERVEKG